MQSLRFEQLLTADGFRPAQLLVDDNGRVAAVEAAEGGPWHGGIALPGMVNAHSHCFQRAMCGYVERAGGRSDFWGWRELMYRIAGRLTPEDLYIVARQAYTEMLQAGYTAVGEFHYLHHGRDGQPGTAMGEAVVAAAASAGIRLALLPVYYERGGFDRGPEPGQRRFVHESVERFMLLIGQLGETVRGVAPHSLRAVDAGRLPQLVTATRELLGEGAVVHLHIAEQQREVEQCRAATGLDPLQLLRRHCELDRRWSLVHATHVDEDQLAGLAATGARVVSCPLTEANLGDGIFPATRFAALGGDIAIGSDCNARIDPVEELRLLEYGQRLARQTRDGFADESGLGARLWQMAAAAGADSLGLAAGRLEPGQLADIVVLDNAPPLAGLPPARALDALITGGDRANVSAVYVGGRHTAPSEPRQLELFAATVRRLVEVV